MFWGRQISGRATEISDRILKMWVTANIWQSLVTIGQANSEIMRRKKEEDLNYNDKTEWPAASIAGGRPKLVMSFDVRCVGIDVKFHEIFWCEIFHEIFRDIYLKYFKSFTMDYGCRLLYSSLQHSK